MSTEPDVLEVISKAKGVLYATFYHGAREPLSPDFIAVTDVNHCQLSAYWNRVQPIAPSLTSVQLMTQGRDVHTALERGFATLGYRTSTVIKQSVTTERTRFTMVGHPDAYNYHHVIDFKTAVSTPKKVKDAYIEQVNAYANMVQLPEFIILYLPRFNDPIAFKYARDREMWGRTLARAESLSASLRSRTPPEPEKSDECKYCQYKVRCPAWNIQSDDTLKSKPPV